MKALVEFSKAEGLKSRTGGKLFKSQIERMLREPFFYGAIRWNGRVQDISGTHQALITKEVFDKIQEVRSAKKAPHFKRHQFQFRKMFKCGECEGTVSAEIQKGIIYYHCNHYRNCSQKKYTPEKQIEDKLFGVFKFFETVTAQEAETIKTRIQKNHTQEIEYKEKAIKTFSDRYSALQKRLDNLYNDRLDEKINLAFWQAKHKEITDEQEGIQQKLSKLKTEEAKYFEIWLNILDLARRAREIYERRNPEERRLLLTHLFSHLSLTESEVKYTLKTAVQKFAERVQQRIDREKSFEPQEKDAKTVTISDTSHKNRERTTLKQLEAQNHFRTTKEPDTKGRNGQTRSKMIVGLRR